MIWLGHGLPEATAALLTATVPQNLLGIYRFRKHINLTAMRWPIILRCVALPAGVFVLSRIENFPEVVVRQIVSGVVLGCVLLITILKPKQREHIPFGWTLLAFLSSGFFAGLTGTGGPMMVLWIQAHDWKTERTRSFLFVMYLISIPISLCLLFYSFESRRITAACVSALALSPLVLLVSRVGLRCGTWLGKERLKRVTMGLLYLLALVGIFGPLFQK